MKEASSFTYVAVCNHAECDFGGSTNAESPHLLRGSASRHAWNHHHNVSVYRCDLTTIVTFDHEGIAAQPTLF